MVCFLVLAAVNIFIFLTLVVWAFLLCSGVISGQVWWDKCYYGWDKEARERLREDELESFFDQSAELESFFDRPAGRDGTYLKVTLKGEKSFKGKG